MQLKEFIDKNGNQVKIPKSGGNTSGNTSKNPNGFKKRLYKIVKYHEHHSGATLEYVAIDKLTEDTIEFTEYHDDGEQVKFIVYIGASTEAWRIQVLSSRGTKDDDSGVGWANLLKQLRYYITVPVTGTPEYMDLMFEDDNNSFINSLKEFVDSKGNKITLPKASTYSQPVASKTNKEKFEELISYMDTHKDSYTTKTKTLKLDDTGFLYQLTRKSPGIKEYTLDFEVEYDETNSSWRFQVDKNSMYLDSDSGKYWEYLLAALKKCAAGYCFNVPTPGSKEYESICESLDSSLAEDFKIYESLWD